MLLDFYGEMLKEQQKQFLEYYYNDDLSLGEISEIAGITRQGVRDSIKRGELQLAEMEEKLGLVARFGEMTKSLSEIIGYTDAIAEINRKTGLSREINDLAVKIKAAALALSE